MSSFKSGMKIAITGGIASGKSSVAKFLAKVSSSLVFDADAVCFDLLSKNRPGWHGVQHKWGDVFFDKNGDIDRKILRKAIFSDHNIRHELEQILHPMVRSEFEVIAKNKKNETSVVFFEVPLLFEVGWQGDFDWVISVFAEHSKRIARICHRDRVSQEEAEKVISAQMDSKEKAMLSDSVVDNSGSWVYTCLQIYHLKQFFVEDI